MQWSVNWTYIGALRLVARQTSDRWIVGGPAHQTDSPGRPGTVFVEPCCWDNCAKPHLHKICSWCVTALIDQIVGNNQCALKDIYIYVYIFLGSISLLCTCSRCTTRKCVKFQDNCHPAMGLTEKAAKIVHFRFSGSALTVPYRLPQRWSNDETTTAA